MYSKVLNPMWSSLSHEHVVPLLAADTNDSSLPILKVPYYKRGNILEHNRHCPGVNKLRQIKQMAVGLRYLHEMHVIHGNICPANILIKDDGGVCISDPAYNSLMCQLTYDTHVPTPATWCYKPWDELLQSTGISPKADVYCWASVVFEVFSGKRPYHGYHYGRGIFKIVNHGHRALNRPPEITPELWNIMQKCWLFKPEARLTMHQVEAELRRL